MVLMTTRRPSPLLPRWGWYAAFVMACGSVSCSASDDQANKAGGQTGSAACGASPRCICDSAAGADVVRGVVTLATTTEASVEVVEVFGETTVSVGERLVGPYQVGFPCGLGNLPLLEDGAEVLVVKDPSGGALTNMYVVAWAPTLQLTPEFSLPSNDAAVLTDRAACDVRFPDREITCKDNF